MTGDEGLFAEEKVREKIEELWESVFMASSKVLNQHMKFGYEGVCKMASPTLEEMVKHLKVFDSLLDVLYLNSELFGIEYQEQRLILNARSQVASMEALMAAVKARNSEDYEKFVQQMDKQAVF